MSEKQSIEQLEARIKELEEKLQAKDLAFALILGYFHEAYGSLPPVFKGPFKSFVDTVFGGPLVLKGFAEVINRRRESTSNSGGQ